MTASGADTASRSLAHWSEAGRREMDAFYAYAALDYVQLAGVLPWGELLAGLAARRGDGRLTLLDVACGSGKFPSALLRHADLAPLSGVRVDYDLLDPSAFSLAEAAGVLAPPFHAGARSETRLEDLEPTAGPWDVVWATHALYALEPAQLDAAAERFLAAIAPGGIGFVAQGSRDGHYLRVYDAFLEGVRGGTGTPYTAVEDLAAAFERAGATPQHRRLTYAHVVEAGEEAVLEGYLQRCLFDDTLGLDELLAAPVIGEYLASCRDPAGGFRFVPEVDCLLIDPQGAPRWTAGS